MKKTALYSLFALLSLGVCFTSCGDDDDDHDHEDNKVTITIEEPTSGAVITDCGDVHIHIDIEATEELHEIEIELHPEDDVNNKILTHDKHTHDKVYNFEDEVNLCDFPAGTCFHLEVVACVDHDCDEKETADAEFCLQ